MFWGVLSFINKHRLAQCIISSHQSLLHRIIFAVDFAICLMPLYHLIYESRATQPFSDRDLLELLRHSRGYNAQRGLTGLLLYSPQGRFLQVLEGEKAEVEALYQHISHDTRHTACLLLLAGPLAARRFAEWRMGFRATRQLTDLAALLGHVDTTSPDFLLPLLPKLSTSLLDRLFDYVHHTPVHELLEETVA
jgi:hypothetical protein